MGLIGVCVGAGLQGGLYLYEQNLEKRRHSGVITDPDSLLGRTDRLVSPVILMEHSTLRWARSMSTVFVVKTSEYLLHQKYEAARWFNGCTDLDLLSLQHRLSLAETVAKSRRGNREAARGRTTDYECEVLRREEQLKRTCRERLDIEEDQELRLLHFRNANRVLNALLSNGGIYIKAGQFASTSLRGVIPDEYVDVLSVLQDQIPSIDYAQVERIVSEEFGQPIDALFSEFSREPIAAASLGQVHRARLRRDGALVAVKVQYPLVEKYLPGDLFTIKQILKLYWYQMPKRQRDTNLQQLDCVTRELDFKLETANMLRSKRQLSNIADLYIPEPVVDMVTGRLLVMEFIDNAIRVSDRAGIQSLGIDPAHVARVLTRAFGEQIFVHGFVHCDPHPGNILVRRNPSDSRKGQVVLLDHGLYTELSPEFRESYLKLWYAILMDDEQVIAEFCARFNMEHPRIFVQALMFQFLLDKVQMQVSVNEAGDEIVAPSQEQFNNVQNLFSSMSFAELNDWRKTMENFPPELRLVMRNQMLLLGVNQLLGSKVDRFAIQAALVRQLVLEGSVSNEETSFWNSLRFNLKVSMFSFLTDLVGWVASFFIKSS